jgi:hypothetical protein
MNSLLASELAGLVLHATGKLTEGAKLPAGSLHNVYRGVLISGLLLRDIDFDKHRNADEGELNEYGRWISINSRSNVSNSIRKRHDQNLSSEFRMPRRIFFPSRA